MGNGDHQGVHAVEGIKRFQVYIVVCPGFLGIGQWIMDADIDAIVFELSDDVNHAGVAQIRHILFKGDAQKSHFSTANGLALPNKQLDRTFGDALREKLRQDKKESRE